MFKLRMLCNFVDGGSYWKDEDAEYETRDEALIECCRRSTAEVYHLMSGSNDNNWFEVVFDYESVSNASLSTVYPVATIWCDKAPWDRENDCDIRVVTGYDIVEVHANMLEKYNAMLKEEFGENITVELQSFMDDDDVERFYYTTTGFGESSSFDAVEDAYADACIYLRYTAEF